MSEVVLTIEQIISNPEIRRGQPVIAGTGLRVSDIVMWHTTGDKLSVEEIAENFKLNLGQVHAALAYYINQNKIDTQIQQDAHDAEQLIASLEKTGRAMLLIA
jgi:uncharacterized protein (DUF433 family)